MYFSRSLLCPSGVLQEAIVQPLQQQWQYYDREVNVYTPFLPGYHTNASQLHLILPIQDVQPYFFNLEDTSITHIFLNNQLVTALKPADFPILTSYSGVA